MTAHSSSLSVQQLTTAASPNNLQHFATPNRDGYAEPWKGVRVSTHRARGPHGFYSTATREWAGYFSGVFFVIISQDSRRHSRLALVMDLIQRKRKVYVHI